MSRYPGVFAAGAAVLLCAGGMAAESAVKPKTVEPVAGSMALEPVDTLKLEMEGVVCHARSVVISFEGKGRLTYVAPVGKYVFSEVLNREGEVVRQGDLLARQDTDIPTSDVKIAEVMCKRAEVVLKEREENFRRDRNLAEKSAVSARQYEETLMLYNTALIDKEKAGLDLERARQVLDACFIRAPFNAVVEEIYRSEGGAADVGDPVLKISMVNPIKIEIHLPDEALPLFNQMTRVLVYPRGQTEPVPAWFQGTSPVSGKIECFAANPLETDDVIGPDGRPLPVIDQLSVVYILPEKAKLAPFWIESSVIRYDDGGAYVWRLAGAGGTDPNRSIPNITTLEKVRVSPLDMLVQYGNVLLEGIKGGGALRQHDVLAGDVPDSVKPGDTVVYRKKRHRFQIGEKVKIVLSAGYGGHRFIVPGSAVRRDLETGGYFVWISDAGQVRRRPVLLLNRSDDTAMIYSSKLARGDRLLLPKPEQKLEEGMLSGI